MKWSYYHRMRKYKRKKLRAYSDKMTQLYWNYAVKVFGELGPSW